MPQQGGAGSTGPTSATDRGDRRWLVELEAVLPGDLFRYGFGYALDVDDGARGACALGHGVRQGFDMAVSGMIENQDLCHFSSPEKGEGAARARVRDGHSGDRIGSRPPAYHASVDAGFRTMAGREPDRVKLVDADGSPQTVTARLLYALGDLLP